MTIGSLFSGIGGLELGLERAGLGPVVWQAENEPYCRRVLAKQWPRVKRFDDVKEVDEHAERPDIICGGFPCQDISSAGKRAGIDGDRSGLWGEFARVLCALRPRVAVIENVPDLLVRGFGRVLRDLHEGGFDAEWDCIPAAAVGAPHRRDRVFVIATYRHTDREGESTFAVDAETSRLPSHVADADGSRQRTSKRDVRRGESDADGRRKAVADTNSESGRRPRDAVERTRRDAIHERPAEPRRRGSAVSDADRGVPRIFQPPRRGSGWSVEPAVGRVANGIPNRTHRLRGLGNAVVPQVAEHIGRCIVEAGLLEVA